MLNVPLDTKQVISGTLFPDHLLAITEKHARTHTRTHTHTQPFYGSLDFVRDNPGEPVPEETFTHSHQSWSSVIPYLLPPSMTICGILPVQFTCPIVFFHRLWKKTVIELKAWWHSVFNMFMTEAIL